jgi:hypothetical protein
MWRVWPVEYGNHVLYRDHAIQYDVIHIFFFLQLDFFGGLIFGFHILVFECNTYIEYNKYKTNKGKYAPDCTILVKNKSAEIN